MAKVSIHYFLMKLSNTTLQDHYIFKKNNQSSKEKSLINKEKKGSKFSETGLSSERKRLTFLSIISKESTSTTSTFDFILKNMMLENKGNLS